MTYIATFFTHFAAISFARQLKGTDMKPQFMPVPRKLSSSCGTCVRFTLEDLDKIYLVEEDNYTPVYEAHGEK